jgi:hypothetical protein
MSDTVNKKGNTRLGMVLGAAVIVIAVVLYFVLAYPWPTQNVSGTIGGVEKAKKYQKEQISSQDVAVHAGDIQQLLQNDKIQKMINDPNFRIAADNEAFRQEVNKNIVFREALEGNAYATVAANKNFGDFLNNEYFRNVLRTGVVERMISNVQLTEALKNEALMKELASKNWRNAVQKNAALREFAAKNPSYIEAMKNESFRDIFAGQAMRELVGNREFVEAFKTEAARTIYQNANFQEALKQASFRNAAASKAFVEVFKNEALKNAKAWDNEAFRTTVFRTAAERNTTTSETQRNMQ